MGGTGSVAVFAQNEIKEADMIAEIKGKVRRDNANLTELGEDELTGNVFGHLRYLSFQKGMKKILKNAVRPTELQHFFEEIDADYWEDHLFLWDKTEENGRFTELDVRMDFERVTIGIEVKYRSGLSSEDDRDAAGISAENSRNQLSREARALRKIAPDRHKVLLLLADESVCAETVKGIKAAEGVALGYFSWQEVLQQLKQLTDLNVFERLIAADLIELLEKKGFQRFENFHASVKEIDQKGYWEWKQLAGKETFSFVIPKKVGTEHYEFGRKYF